MQSWVAGLQNQPQNWPPVPSEQTAVLGPKLGFWHLAKQSSWAAGLKISSPLRLMFAPCVHNSEIPLQFQASAVYSLWCSVHCALYSVCSVAGGVYCILLQCIMCTGKRKPGCVCACVLYWVYRVL